MSKRRSGADILAEKGVSPFSDNVDRYLQMRADYEVLRRAVENNEQIDGLVSMHSGASLNSDRMKNRDALIMELADIERELWKRAEKLSKVEVAELKALEMTGPGGGPFQVVLGAGDDEL